MKRLINRQKMILDFIKSCNDSLIENPDDIQVIRLRGLMYNVAGEYDKAIENFERTVQSLPGDAVAYYLKSNSHYSRGEFNQAKRDYMKGLKIQHETTFTEEQINSVVVTDDQDLLDIKTVIDHEKEQAISRYFNELSSD